MLGVCDNENKRQRLLMKVGFIAFGLFVCLYDIHFVLQVLALSDIIIYKTRAERLQNDLFHFLGDASKSYNNHFLDELMEVATASGDSRDGYTNDMGNIFFQSESTILFFKMQRKVSFLTLKGFWIHSFQVQLSSFRTTFSLRMS